MASNTQADEKGVSDGNTSAGSTRAPSEFKDEQKPINDRAQEAGDDEFTSRLAAHEQDDGIVYPEGVTFILILASLLLCTFLMALDQTIVATAIPKITDQFHSINDVSWYGSAYFITVGGFQPTWGKAYKYFSLKYTFLFSIGIFELGSLICAVAPSSTALIVGRAIAGIGGAGLGAGAFTIVVFAAKPKFRPICTGIMGAMYSIAAVIGPLLGGVFSDKATWRWCFYVNLPLGGLATVFIVIFFKTPKHAKPAEATWKEKILQMDPIGIALAMCGILCYTLAMQYGGQTHPWQSSVVIGLIVGFVLIVITFCIWEAFQGERGAIVPRVFVDRNVWVNGFFGMMIAASYFIVIYYLPIYFQSIDNVSPIESGVRNFALIIPVAIGLIIAGASITKTGVPIPFMVVGSAIATVASGLLYNLDLGSSTGKWIGYQIIGGFAWGLCFQVPMMAGQGRADLKDMSSVTATILFLQFLGGAFGISAAQAAFANRLVIQAAISAPTVSPALLLTTGATELQNVFSADQLPGVLLSYMAGVKAAFAVAIGCAGMSFALSFLSKWDKLDSHAKKEPEIESQLKPKLLDPLA